MARFAAGARQVIVRAAAVGVLLAAGWLLAVALRDALRRSGGRGHHRGDRSSGSRAPNVAASAARSPTVRSGNGVSASDDAEAMAGRRSTGSPASQTPAFHRLPPPTTFWTPMVWCPPAVATAPSGRVWAMSRGLITTRGSRLGAPPGRPCFPLSSAQRRTTPLSLLTDPRHRSRLSTCRRRSAARLPLRQWVTRQITGSPIPRGLRCARRSATSHGLGCPRTVRYPPKNQ